MAEAMVAKARKVERLGIVRFMGSGVRGKAMRGDKGVEGSGGRRNGVGKSRCNSVFGVSSGGDCVLKSWERSVP
jgi:hypothetical protein